MSRGIGAVEAVQAALPEWATPLVVAITQFGDVWVFFLVLPPLYWFGPRLGLLDRDRAGLLVGTALAGFSLVVALKSGFALPRPPESMHLAAADGYGFPSGHAIGATVVYGSIAALLDRPAARTRYAAMGAVIALVALSRVALGVHYLVDVVVGVAVGATVVATAVRVGRRRPERVLRAAVGIGVLAVVVVALRTGWLTENAAEAVGGTVGGLAGWTWAAGRGGDHDVRLVAGAAGLVAFGGLKVASEALQPEIGLVGVAVANALIFFGLVGLPGLHVEAVSER